MKIQFGPTSMWIDTNDFPRALAPPDDRWRENPYWKFNDRDIDPSEIDAWNEARMTGYGPERVGYTTLDEITCKKLTRYFLIFLENKCAFEWYSSRDPIKRLVYLKKWGPIVAEARRRTGNATKREDVDRMYDWLAGLGVGPV